MLLEDYCYSMSWIRIRSNLPNTGAKTDGDPSKNLLLRMLKNVAVNC